MFHVHAAREHQKFFMADSLAPEINGHVTNDMMETCLGLPYYMTFETREDVDLSRLFQKSPFVLFFSKRYPNLFRTKDFNGVENHLTAEEMEELKVRKPAKG